MTNFLSSSVVRLVGLVLLAVAINLGTPREALAWECVERPFMACLECFDVPVQGGGTCDVMICVAGPTYLHNCEE